VSRFKELRELNNGEEVDGLVLIVSFAFNGKISVKIEMPSSFSVSCKASGREQMANFNP
jgi:hypothetical protein